MDNREAIAGPLEGHTMSILSAAFSPDGKRVISGSRDATIHIWDVEKLFTWIRIYMGETRFIGGYCLDSDSGWSHVLDASGKDRRLFWVPSRSRLGFHGIATSDILGTPHVTRVDFSRFVHGVSCYSPENSSRRVCDKV